MTETTKTEADKGPGGFASVDAESVRTQIASELSAQLPGAKPEVLAKLAGVYVCALFDDPSRPLSAAPESES